MTIWLLTLLLLYIGMRIVGKRLAIKLHAKTAAKTKDDLLRLLYFGMVQASIAGIAPRIDEGVVNQELHLSFVPLVIYHTVFFTFLFEYVRD